MATSDEETLLEGEVDLRLPAKPNGLFAAVHHDAGDVDSPYAATWLRDTVHIAEGRRLTPGLGGEGEEDVTPRTAATLLAYLESQAPRFDACIEGRVDVDDPMERPHIRFDGDTLEELPEHWPHAQNDALGAALWFIARAILRGDVERKAGHLRTLGRIARFFRAVDYSRDRDSGHWEEHRKRSASSVGVALAGLEAFAELLGEGDEELASPGDLEELCAEGRAALAELLPDESRGERDPRANRSADAALLFLIEPFGVVDDSMAARILARVGEELEGEIGVRRYRGDSYWMAGYTELREGLPSQDAGEGILAARDAIFTPGTEAEWALFDPLISVIHGRRYLRSGDPRERMLQRRHFERALRQVTGAGCEFGAGLCPEAYFRESRASDARWICNENTPLLWTVAHLRLAIAEMRRVDALEGARMGSP